jgi:hypothetical protein
MRTLVVRKYLDLRRQREMLELARDAAFRRCLERRLQGQPALQLELDVLDGLAIRRQRVGRIVHGERVERVAVPRRMHFRLEDRQSGVAEEAANAREQLLLVGYVDDDLQARAVPRQTRFRDRRRPVDAPVQVPRVPRDLVGRMALEIGRVEMAP